MLQMKRPSPKRLPPPKPGTHTADDQATADRLMQLLKAGADARPAMINRVKGSVDTSTYENDLKLTIAVDRLAREL